MGQLTARLAVVAALGWMVSSTAFAEISTTESDVMAGPVIREQGSPLGTAAYEGDLVALQEHFEGTPPTLAYRALRNALMNNQLKAAEWLLEQGVPPDTDTQQFFTALFEATSKRSLEGVKLLCRYGADPNRPTSHGYRSLHQALGAYPESNLPIIKALLACGADPKIPDQTRYYRGRELQPPVNIPTIVGAISSRDARLVRLLLEHGAPANEIRPCCEASPLSRAAGQPEIFSLLIEYGADPLDERNNPKGVFQSMTCQVSPEDKPEASLELLVQKGVSLQKMAGDSLPVGLGCAAKKGRVEIVRALLEVGADPNERGLKGRVPLDTVVENYRWLERIAGELQLQPAELEHRWARIVELLTDYGADPAVSKWVLMASQEENPIGEALRRPVTKRFAGSLAECMANRSSFRSRHSELSPEPSSPAHEGGYTLAKVQILEQLPAPAYGPSISPDGQWLLYPTGSRWEQSTPATLVVHNLDKDTAGSTQLEAATVRSLTELYWSQDSRLVKFRQYDLPYIDLAKGRPIAVEEARFEPSSRAGHEPCVSRNEQGQPVRGQDEIFDLKAPWSPDGQAEYPLVRLDNDSYALVEKRASGQEKLVVHDIKAARDEALKEVEEMHVWQKDEMEGITPEQKKAMKMLQAQLRERAGEIKLHMTSFQLSPVGNFLYYQLKTAVHANDSSDEVRNIVVDVRSRPVRVWQIPGSVIDPRWHPNEQELYFATRRTETSKNSSRQIAIWNMAVVRFH